MSSIYDPCPCNSGKKFKFCCREILRDEPSEVLEKAFISLPVKVCVIGRDWQTQGMTSVLVVREIFHGNFVVGMYLVDIWCLGVKDASITKEIDTDDLQKMFADIMMVGNGMLAISYEDARSLVLGALNYAKKNGFEPHPDWERAKYAIEPNRAFENKFTFGRNGKPFYAAGPYDRDVCQEYIKKVKALGGAWWIPADDEWEEE